MRKIIISSSGYEGEVALIYDEHNQLQQLDMSAAVVTDIQIEYFKKRVPVKYEGLDALKVSYGNSKTAEFVEEGYEVTFDMFYNKYKLKRNPDRCKAIWNKLTPTERLKAYAGIAPYDRHLSKNTWKTKADPHTYLKNKYWNNEY